jgi:hypothetical protein
LSSVCDTASSVASDVWDVGSSTAGLGLGEAVCGSVTGGISGALAYGITADRGVTVFVGPVAGARCRRHLW